MDCNILCVGRDIFSESYDQLSDLIFCIILGWVGAGEFKNDRPGDDGTLRSV